jgi:hypothetical protein
MERNMASQTDRESAAAAMERINRAWLDRRPADLHALFHPDVTIALPGFVGRVEGRQALVAGFEDFCSHATVEDYRGSNHQVDVVGDTAVVSFEYQIVYELSGMRNRATGRDLWVFARQGSGWLAVWRTMLNLQEQPA